MADYNINAVTRRVVYTGSAGVGPYAFSFEVLAATDIAVYKNATKLTLTTNYTVTINANGTGSITLTSAATGSDKITIIGARAIERTTDFVTAGDLLAASLNEQLDSQIVMIQQLAEENKRTLKAPQYDPAAVEDGGTVNMVLPVASSRAGKTLAFDSNGNPTVGEDIGNWRGNWAATTSYTVRDLVKDASNSNVYRCNTAHTSSGTTPISSNSDTAKWDLVIDAAAAGASAAASAASATESAASAALANDWATKTSAPVAGGEYSAKYHAQQSASSASAAASSASAASSSQSAAASSASTSSTQATNAASSASTASTQASNAAASASTASTQASNASSSASAASASASSASASQSGAATSATNAANSASAASTSATNAASSASSASSSATNADTAKTAAQTAQAAAEAARDATLTAYDNFDDRYLGAKASDPSVDNDGNALLAGSLYFNTTSAAMKLWTGSAWVVAYVSGAGVLATAGGTMTGPIAMSGQKITGLGTPTATDDAVTKSYADASSSNKVPLAGGTMTGNLVMSGSAEIRSTAASEDARATGYKIANGTDIGECNRSTQYYDDRIANCRGVGTSGSSTNCGVLPNGNCSGNTSYNPPNGNWWTWGVSGVPTANCSNNSQFDGAGGTTSTLYANTVSFTYDAYYEAANEIGGSEQRRNYNNCNCGNCNANVGTSLTYGPFNCRTNCNCNCDCNCDCNC